MAGTDKSKVPVTGGPAVILVEPQLGENIGFVARAMLNCGMTDLRLVRPRDGWPSDKALAAASGADRVIDAARLYASTEEAIAGLSRVYATTARPRYMIKPVMTPRRAASELRSEMAAGIACGLLFGRERSGLDNDEIVLADTLIQVPLNPAFSSLSLPQAVLLVAYEWYQAGVETPPEELVLGRTQPADKAALLYFFERLEGLLDDTGFFTVPDKRAGMIRNIRNIFQRKHLTEQELRTLHGILTALEEGPRGDGAKPRRRRTRRTPPASTGSA